MPQQKVVLGDLGVGDRTRTCILLRAYGFAIRCVTIPPRQLIFGVQRWIRTTGAGLLFRVIIVLLYLDTNKTYILRLPTTTLPFVHLHDVLVGVPGIEPGMRFRDGVTVHCLTLRRHTLIWWCWVDLNHRLLSYEPSTLTN